MLRTFGLIISTLLVVAQATRDSFYDVEQFPHPLPPYAPHPADYDATIAPSSLVWPPPRSMSVTGSPLPLHESFTITTLVEGEAGLSEGQHGILRSIVDRYTAIIDLKTQHRQQPTTSATTALHELVIRIDASNATSDVISEATRYGYTLRVDAGQSDGHAVVASATAESIYGAQYVLESFAQLVDPSRGGVLFHDNIHIDDAPQYQWRGLMIDTGRRFFPMSLVENLLHTMAAAKLNVLHFHASDMCRFGVESKLFPNLTSSLTGIHAGFYTQKDIASLQSFAKTLGIRVVPEFDLPGHSRGYIPVSYGADGVEFCEPSASTRSQLYGDPQGKTYAVIHSLMKEMSGLFEDQVFNIGCDETGVKGPCTLKSTFDLERKVFTAIANELHKTPEGWEEAYFDAQAATPDTIVNAWARHTAAEITKTGRRAVESKAGAFYFTGAAPGGPTGWKKCWYDIATNVPASELHLLLGGEMSMWTDTYLYINQCGASGGGAPVGHALYPPARDAEFGKSIGGMIWPRGFVGAAAFWNFDASTDPSSSAFVASIYKLNDEVASRGGFVCKTNCTCNQLSECGEPYIKPGPAAAGSAVGIAPCADDDVNQIWKWNNKTKTIVLGSNPSLCLAADQSQTYPLKLDTCAPGNAHTQWVRSSKGEMDILNSGLKECLDVKTAAKVDGGVALGTWPCGSHEGLDQPNQHWAHDSISGNIVSLAAGTPLAGQCVSVDSS